MAKILVVEDDASVRENIGEILTGAGFSVTLAQNAGDALKIAFNNAPDLILSDLRMEEEESGFRLLERLTLDRKTAKIPFIFISAHKERQRQGMNIGADDFLTKPFTQDELLAAVRARLKRQEVLNEDPPVKPAYAYIILRSPGLPEAGTRFDVEGYLMIGRNPKCNVRVGDPYVSSIGCVIQPKQGDANGRCWITDGPIAKTPTPSLYGVFVNGHRIEGHTTLNGGERVEISPQTWFEFRTVEPNDVADPTQSSSL